VSKKVLGKGLEALIPQGVTQDTVRGNVGADAGERVIAVPLDAIDANPLQPRKTFDDEKIKQLSESIKEDGVLQPVVVRRRGARYELIMGERRFQAARLAGAASVPAIVKDVRDADSLRLALVENIQRENLNAIEVANAYRHLIAAFGLSQSDLAGLVGRDRSSVANTLRLLNLPDEVQKMIVAEQITEGHARALLSLPTQKEQLTLARRVVEQNLSVRQTEVLTGMTRAKKTDPDKAARKTKPSYVVDLEKAFSSHLGTKVAIDEKRGGKGRITVEFYSHDDFERLAELMNIPLPR
jgi:ParB family chromosome partitioning protein